MNHIHQANQPIIIHSLFRSGSTYLFNKFRESANGYWCYQEPLNEFFLHKIDRKDLVTYEKDKMNQLRHPNMEKPYFYEFYHIWDEIKDIFQKEFCYDTFFDVSGTENRILSYFTLLIKQAQGRPMIQCTRSYARAKYMAQNFDALNIFLWRNPWDQWWSYKINDYFDTINLLILNAKNTTLFFNKIKSEINFVEFHNENIFKEILFFRNQKITSKQSYLLFYANWCFSLIENLKWVDMDINIDKLSLSQTYKKNISADLEKFNHPGFEFSDCSVTQSIFTREDKNFFLEIENEVYGYFLQSGYSQQEINDIISLRKQMDPNYLKKSKSSGKNESNPISYVRNVVFRLESELANKVTEIKNERISNQTTNEKIKSELTAKQNHNNYLTDLLNQSKSTIEQLTINLKNSNDKIDEVYSELEEAREKNDKLNKDIFSKLEHNIYLANLLSETKIKVEHLNIKLKTIDDQIVVNKKLEDALLDAKFKASRFVESHFELLHTVHLYQSHLAKINADLVFARNEINKRDHEIHNNNELINKLNFQLNAIFNSKSWKITYPMRITVFGIKKITNFLQNIIISIKNSLKNILKTLLSKAIIIILQRPLLKRIFRFIINKIPYLKRRLHTFSINNNLAAKVVTTIYPIQNNMLNQKKSNQHSVDNAQMSEQTKFFYKKLKKFRSNSSGD